MENDVKEFLSELLKQLKSIDYIKPEDIPNIDLYMDQVTTFMDEQLAASKRYESDKILTKTMINNYAKNNLHYFEENDRPQPKLDRMLENGMAVSIGRLREDNQYDYKFVCLSHNTLRGAAGGAVLLAELLAAKGYFD